MATLTEIRKLLSEAVTKMVIATAYIDEIIKDSTKEDRRNNE